MGTWKFECTSTSGKGIADNSIQALDTVLDEMYNMGYKDGLEDGTSGAEPDSELGKEFLDYADQRGGNAVALSRFMSIEYANGYDAGYAAGALKRQQARHVLAGGMK